MSGTSAMTVPIRFLSPRLILASLCVVMFASCPAVALERRVRIINASNVTMNSFYAENIASQTDRDDLLGASVILTGESVVLDVNDGSDACSFDFKAVMVDGRMVCEYDFNVCEISTWTAH